MTHVVAQSTTFAERFITLITATYMRWYGAPIALACEVVAATSETTSEASVDATFPIRSTASNSAQSVSFASTNMLFHTC